MIQLRPVLGGMHRQGGAGRLGAYWLHRESPGMYRISDTDQDRALFEESPDMWRFTDVFPGTGAIVSVGGFFRIYG